MTLRINIFIGVLLAIALTSCVSFPKPARDDQWSYFEEWDSNDNVFIDSEEFAMGYVEQGFFKTWAGKRKVVSNEVLTVRLANTNDNLKRALAETGGWDTVASARRSTDVATDEELLSVQLREYIQSVDTNGDHLTSREEWVSAMFKLADENRDGKLSPIEFYLWELLRG